MMQADRASLDVEALNDKLLVRKDDRSQNNRKSVSARPGRSGSSEEFPGVTTSGSAPDAFAEGRIRFAEHGAEMCDAILACFDRALVLRRIGDVAADADPVDVYFSDKVFTRISPNVLFDEQWYINRYKDVGEAVSRGKLYSGFVHFIIHGLHEGRSPNATLDLELAQADQIEIDTSLPFNAGIYLRSYPIVGKFIEFFPLIDAARFYDLFGRRLGHTVWDTDGIAQKPFYDQLSYEFDHEYYCATYLGGTGSRSMALQHYMSVGMRTGNNPNPGFDETWYRTFYLDINKAVGTGKIHSGFHHYLMSGKREGRRPTHDLRYALDARMAGVADPRLVQRADDITQRMRSLPHRLTRQGDARIWFCLPMLNPDISFGGYKAVFELIKATARAGHAIGIFVTEDPTDDISYFLYRERDRELVSVLSQATYVNRMTGTMIQIGVDDLFVVYSVWDAYIVQPFLKDTRAKRFLLLAQEFEPIFYECGSTRALTQDAYRFDHVPLYNSRFLKTYFATHAVGPFARGNAAREGIDYFTFEHVPTHLSVDETRADPSVRTLAFYARPEMHAARNLFELGYIALRKLCSEGVFDHRWRFVGLGSLQDNHLLPLGGEHRIEMIQKMPLDEYARFMSSIDIGLSLMLAPHPSVVPFEFAATGAVVVTNTYENRSASELESICRNFVPCEPTLDGVEAALRAAVTRAEDFETRQSQRLSNPGTTWKNTFSEKVLKDVFGALSDRNRDASLSDHGKH